MVSKYSRLIRRASQYYRHKGWDSNKNQVFYECLVLTMLLLPHYEGEVNKVRHIPWPLFNLESVSQAAYQAYNLN